MRVPGFWGLLAGYRELARRLEGLEFEVDGLKASHKRLSGRLSATPPRTEPPPEPAAAQPDRTRSKDEIRRQLHLGRLHGVSMVPSQPIQPGEGEEA